MMGVCIGSGGGQAELFAHGLDAWDEWYAKGIDSLTQRQAQVGLDRYPE